MKAKILCGAMAALVLTACSQDEEVCVQQDGIAYSVAVPSQTRAADSYCNNSLPNSFHVWALTNEGELYINGDEIERTGSTWSDKSGTHYWPEGKTLDFYAQVNGDNEFHLNNGAPSFDDFTVKDNVGDQVDLIYSVKKAQSKSGDGKVQLNFRHALSQVCFKAKNNTKAMQVTIKGVSVGHLTNTGSFTFPTTDTDENYVHHSDDADNKTLNGGTWAYPDNAQYNKQYDVTPLAGAVTLSPGDAQNLTCPGDVHDESASTFAQVLTLLPQTVEAWDPAQKGADWNGAYFLVDLALSNITTDNGVDVVTDLYTGKAAIPVSVAWEQGYRYIYTFVFDEGGNGGYTPDPSDPKPVLTSIKYDVTVDDFIPVGPDNGNTNMDTNYKYNTILRLHANDGTGAAQDVNIGGNSTPYAFTLASEYTPVREGYTFKGWAEAANATEATFAAGDVISIDMTKNATDLYAVWEETQVRYSWTFDLQGGTDPKYPDGSSAFGGWSGNRANGTTRALPTIAPVKDGYTFKGWALTAGGEVKYNVGDKVTLDRNNPNLTFYAVWEEATVTIVLSYDVVDGTGTIPSQSQTVKIGEKATFTVSTTAPKKEGQYQFLGWSYTRKTEDGVLADVDVQAGDIIQISESKTLYAIYGKTTPTIGGGGSGSGWDD